MSSNINGYDFKTAYDNAVFLSYGDKNNILPVAGTTFGAGAALAADFITAHENFCARENSAPVQEVCSGARESGNAENCKRAVVLCRDSGYFSVVKRIRAVIGEWSEQNAKNGGSTDGERFVKAPNGVIYFSVDNDLKRMSDVKILLESVNNMSCLVVAGDGELIFSAIECCANKKVDALVIPTDFNFDKAVLCDEERKENGFIKKHVYFAFDEKVFSALRKNDVADAVRGILSKRILFAEMRVNQLIGLHFDAERAKSLINESIKACGDYFKDYDYKKLIYAKSLGILAELSLPFSDPVKAISDVLSLYDIETQNGEREYLAYKILAKVYGIALAADIDTLKVPSYAFCKDEIETLLPHSTIYSAPDYYAENNKLSELLSALKADEKLNATVEELNRRVPQCEKIIYLLYGGRKYSVEGYPVNIKIQALRLAPLMTKGDNLLKIIWAAGFIDLAR